MADIAKCPCGWKTEGDIAVVLVALSKHREWCLGISAPAAFTLADLATVIADAIAAGWHSEKIAREICRRFGGQAVPKVE